jgi:perosamine synthetase
MKRLKALGLPARPFFYPLSSLPAYAGMEAKGRADNPRSYDICARGINLPGALVVTAEQIEQVCDGIHRILNR